MPTRGVTNNNPGNIRRSNDKWAGLADEQLDPQFFTFKSPEYGIRAICRLLLTYQARGIDTVRRIITTWAPVVENDTEAYISDVARRCNVGPNDTLDVDQEDVMRELVIAIIVHENGAQPYPISVINDGMRLAGVADIAPAPVMASKTSQGAAITTIGAGVAAASETVRQVGEVRDTVDQATDIMAWLLHFGPWIAVAFIVAGTALAFYDHMRKRARLGV